MNTLLFIISLYVVLESLYAAQHLHRGGKICQFMRYFFSMLAGVLGLYLALSGSDHADFLIASIAIALNLWPQTYYRFMNHYDRRWRT